MRLAEEAYTPQWVDLRYEKKKLTVQKNHLIPKRYFCNSKQLSTLLSLILGIFGWMPVTPRSPRLLYKVV